MLFIFKKQVNEVVHISIMVVISLASFHFFIDVPIYIGNIVNNEIL
jgi:hypothetical protein